MMSIIYPLFDIKKKAVSRRGYGLQVMVEEEFHTTLVPVAQTGLMTEVPLQEVGPLTLLFTVQANT